jgi:peptidoglycan/xylan/chitin deacetylase (PgdA/CDA1 family)
LAENYSEIKTSEIMRPPANEIGRVVVLTFDDAFENLLENVVPVLKEYQLPAAIFVPTKDLGRQPTWEMLPGCPDTNETIMSEEQIADLNRDGFEIFSHTVSHPVLTEIEDERLQAEFVESRDSLEKIVAHQVVTISYPYGAHDLRTCRAAQKAGYKFGFTIEPCAVDGSTDPMRIGRFGVCPQDSLLKFKLKVYGAYGVVGILKAVRMRIASGFRRA